PCLDEAEDLGVFVKTLLEMIAVWQGIAPNAIELTGGAVNRVPGIGKAGAFADKLVKAIVQLVELIHVLALDGAFLLEQQNLKAAFEFRRVIASRQPHDASLQGVPRQLAIEDGL